MASVTFRLPDPPSALSPDEERAFAAACLAGGYDLAPAPTHRLDDRAATHRLVTLARDSPDSGTLVTPWPDAAQGDTACSTATLRPRAEPYDLLTELARGRLNLVRNQLFEWELIGLEAPPGDKRELAEVTKRFARAALGAADGGDAAGWSAAREVIRRSLGLADRLAAQFAAQLIETRLADGGPLPTHLGVRLCALPTADVRSSVASTFTALRLVPDWRAIEPAEAAYDWKAFDSLVNWACGTGLSVSVGPVIDLADGRFPDWVRQWEGDLPSLAAFFCDFAETLIRRYQGKVRSWQVASGMNHADRFGLGEDDRPRMAARLFDAARRADAAANLSLGLALPFGDYLADENHTVSPLVFADMLVRDGAPLASIDLELLAASPSAGRAASDRGAPPRDALTAYRMIELMGHLSVPLEVTCGRSLAGPLTTSTDATLALALALPQVQGVYWEAFDQSGCDRLADCALNAPHPAAVALRKRLKDWRIRYLA